MSSIFLKMNFFKSLLLLVCFLCFAFAISCRQDCKCSIEHTTATFKNDTLNIWKETRLVVDSLRIINKLSPIDPMFGLHIQILGTDTLLSFMTKDKTLIGFDIERNVIKTKVSLAGLQQLRGAYVANLQADTLLIIRQKDNFFYKFILSSNGAHNTVDSFNISSITEFKDIDISFIVGRQGALYQTPFLYFKYGTHSENDNFIGQYAYIRFNTLSKTIDKLVSYPRCYKYGNFYLPTSSISYIKNNQIVVVFDYYDALYFYSLMGKNLSQVPIKHLMGDSCKMLEFDKSKEQNLAYIRKYLAKSEANVSLLKTPLEHLILLQRRGKEALYDETNFNIYLFDSLHNQVYSALLPYKLRTALEYKNGIVILNDSLNSVYYYDFKN